MTPDVVFNDRITWKASTPKKIFVDHNGERDVYDLRVKALS